MDDVEEWKNGRIEQLNVSTLRIKKDGLLFIIIYIHLLFKQSIIF